MKKDERSPALKYFLITLGVGAAVSVIIALLRGMGAGHTAVENAGIMSDGFFIAGIMLAGVGALFAISGKTDFFDMLSYGFKSLVVMFTPFKKPENHPRFYEYKEARRDARRLRPPRMFLLYAGLVLIALAALCLVIWGY